MAEACGQEARFVHVASEAIAKIDNAMGPNLLGDKAHSVIFDNSKIRSLVPEFNPKISFSEGVKEIVKFYIENPAFQIVDKKIDARIDKIIGKFGA